MAANGFDDDQTRSFTNLAAGTIISHYKIISKIGAGGMGEVYLAEDAQLDRKVALKFLPPNLSQDEAARARFTREAKAAAKLDHPNIVPVYEVGEFQGRPFFAMAHIEGKSLKEVIKEGKLSVNETVELTKQICEGLNKAHNSGVVHRDIKPGNIIIDEDNKARILDFGLATVAGEDKLTKTGSTLGTVGYMSPEQIEGNKVDHRSDLFSIGVILYEMLTGRRPFEGDNDAAAARSITDTTPEPIARYKSGTTGGLQQIVDKALSKDPWLRYQHADGMLADLMRAKQSMESEKPTVAVSPTTHRLMRSWWIAAAVVIVAAISLGVWISRDEAGTPTSTLRQITYFGDIQRCEISPDGASYAYSRGIGEYCYLFVSDFKGGNPVELLKCGFIQEFRWSPDGSELAVSYSADSLSGTFLIPRLGGESRKLSSDICSDLCVAWSPNGDHLAVHNSCKVFDSIAIVQITPLAASMIPLNVKGGFSKNLDWATEGNRLLFTSNYSTYDALWTIPLDSYDPVELISGNIETARWSDDGRAIYYAEQLSRGTRALMKIEVDENSGGRSGDPRVLFPDFDASCLSISENNDNLIFNRRDICSNLWYTSIGEDGQEHSKQLTFGTALHLSPAISPDGESVIYAWSKEGRTDIYLLPLDRGNPKRLTFEGLYNLGPAWSPDGKEIAYSSSADGKDYHVKILNPRSGNTRTLPSSHLERAAAVFGLHWGPDGNIYLQKPGNRNIVLLNAESGARSELIQDESEGWLAIPRVSPDGKSVTVVWNNTARGPGIYLLSFTDSSHVCLFKEGGAICLGWSPDGEWIVSFRWDNRTIYRIHRTGKKLDTLGVLPFAPELTDFLFETLPAASPDLGAYVSVEVDIKTDVWLIEDFDPDID